MKESMRLHFCKRDRELLDLPVGVGLRCLQTRNNSLFAPLSSPLRQSPQSLAKATNKDDHDNALDTMKKENVKTTNAQPRSNKDLMQLITNKTDDNSSPHSSSDDDGSMIESAKKKK